MPYKILVIEDDVNIANLLQIYLSNAGWSVIVAHDGQDGVDMFRRAMPDLVLLDIMLPGMDGRSVAREIRADGQTPIIILSARGETHDKVSLLNIGADDYITKPFDSKELLARVQAVIRRSKADNGNAADARVEYDNLLINPAAYELYVRGERINLPPKEFELLLFLANSPNRVYTRNQLLDNVWGFDYFGDSRTVDVHVKRLREKLDGASEQWSLATVWRVGYKFEVNAL